MVQPKFKLGDRVVWTSQAGGYIREKSGEIIEVVPPKEMPKTKVKDPGIWRSHESYVVRASYQNRHGRKRTTNYWPRVQQLSIPDPDKPGIYIIPVTTEDPPLFGAEELKGK